MKTLVTIGRGGTGKSSFTAMMAKYFIDTGCSPLLLVDADPDQNLAEMIGVDMKDAGKSTMAELIVDTFIEKGGTTVGVSPTERIESRIWANGLYEGDHFDFMSVGTKWVEGCYCMPNSALKAALEHLDKELPVCPHRLARRAGASEPTHHIQSQRRLRNVGPFKEKHRPRETRLPDCQGSRHAIRQFLPRRRLPIPSRA